MFVAKLKAGSIARTVTALADLGAAGLAYPTGGVPRPAGGQALPADVRQKQDGSKPKVASNRKKDRRGE